MIKKILLGICLSVLFTILFACSGTLMIFVFEQMHNDIHSYVDIFFNFIRFGSVVGLFVSTCWSFIMIFAIWSYVFRDYEYDY